MDWILLGVFPLGQQQSQYRVRMQRIAVPRLPKMGPCYGLGELWGPNFGGLGFTKILWLFSSVGHEGMDPHNHPYDEVGVVMSLSNMGGG